MNTKANNRNYDERPVGEFFWVDDRLVRLVEQTRY